MENTEFKRAQRFKNPGHIMAKAEKVKQKKNGRTQNRK